VALWQNSCHDLCLAHVVSKVTQNAKSSTLTPVYNEANTIHVIITRVEAVDLGGVRKELIIVDDASKDDPREILDDLRKVSYCDRKLLSSLPALPISQRKVP